MGRSGGPLALALALAVLCTACTTHPLSTSPSATRASRSAPAQLIVPALPAPVPFDPAEFDVGPGEVTVQDNFVLRAYDRLHPPRYRAWAIEFAGAGGARARAHFLVPPGEGPHPAVMVFPILGGSHVVSEAAGKAFVQRGYAVLRVERHRIFPPTRAPQPEWDRVPLDLPAVRLAEGLADGRRLLDWLERRPEIDPQRIGVVGISIGGIMAATLMGTDERIRGGVFVMAGGGLPEILLESTETPVRRFREVHCGGCEPAAFLARLRPLTTPLDPLTWAHRIAPERVVIVSGRFDRVVPPERTEALWEALGRPRWHRYPAGHYTIAPYFWWAMGRGADHLDRALVPPGVRGASGPSGQSGPAAASSPSDASSRSPRSRSRSTTRSPASGPGEKPRS